MCLCWVTGSSRCQHRWNSLLCLLWEGNFLFKTGAEASGSIIQIILLDTGTRVQLAVPVAGVTPVAQGALGSKGHTRVGDQVEICLFLLGRVFFLRCLVETVLCFQLECMQCPLDDSQMENVITCSASKCPHLFAIKHLKKHL